MYNTSCIFRLQISSPNVRPLPTSDNASVPALADLSENTDDKDPSALTTNFISSTDDTNSNDSQNKLQTAIDMDDIHHVDSKGISSVQGGKEIPSIPDETSLNVSQNQNDNGIKKMPVLDESNKPGLLETTDDHFGNKEIAGIQKDLAENLPKKSKVLSLDSYLKEHFDGDTQCKDPISIAAVPCATGSEVTISDDTIHPLKPCSDESPILAAKKVGNFSFNKEKQDGAVENKLNNHVKELNNFDVKKDSLKAEEGVANNILSDSSSTPDEPLDGFVFVNQDGTARGDHGSSPVRLSPTFPQENNSDSDRFI